MKLRLNEARLKKLQDMLYNEFPREPFESVEPKKRKLSTMKGEILLSDDWDSKEINEEIARTFYKGNIVPTA